MQALTIGEAAAHTGWSARMLRYLEAVGLVLPTRTQGGYRVYGDHELQQLRDLRLLREQYGIELGAPGRRVRRLDEYLTVVRGLLTDEVTTFTGEWFQLVDARCAPAPVQRPLPLLVGATEPRMLRLAARYANEWNHWSGWWSSRRSTPQAAGSSGNSSSLMMWNSSVIKLSNSER